MAQISPPPSTKKQKAASNVEDAQNEYIAHMSALVTLNVGLTITDRPKLSKQTPASTPRGSFTVLDNEPRCAINLDEGTENPHPIFPGDVLDDATYEFLTTPQATVNAFCYEFMDFLPAEDHGDAPPQGSLTLDHTFPAPAFTLPLPQVGDDTHIDNLISGDMKGYSVNCNWDPEEETYPSLNYDQTQSSSPVRAPSDADDLPPQLFLDRDFPTPDLSTLIEDTFRILFSADAALQMGLLVTDTSENDELTQEWVPLLSAPLSTVPTEALQAPSPLLTPGGANSSGAPVAEQSDSLDSQSAGRPIPNDDVSGTSTMSSVGDGESEHQAGFSSPALPTATSVDTDYRRTHVQEFLKQPSSDAPRLPTDVYVLTPEEEKEHRKGKRKALTKGAVTSNARKASSSTSEAQKRARVEVGQSMSPQVLPPAVPGLAPIAPASTPDASTATPATTAPQASMSTTHGIDHLTLQQADGTQGLLHDMAGLQRDLSHTVPFSWEMARFAEIPADVLACMDRFGANLAGPSNDENKVAQEEGDAGSSDDKADKNSAADVVGNVGEEWYEPDDTKERVKKNWLGPDEVRKCKKNNRVQFFLYKGVWYIVM